MVKWLHNITQLVQEWLRLNPDLQDGAKSDTAVSTHIAGFSTALKKFLF